MVIWKLKKCVYGLNEAARMWYLSLSTELLAMGMEKSRYDEAIFFWHNEGHLQGVMSAHVDDFFWAGTDLFESNVLAKLTSTFKISKESQNSFKYLGIQLNQESQKISLDQSAYEDDLQTIRVVSNSDSKRVLTKEKKHCLKQTVGQLLWIANQSRPDIAFKTCYLSNCLSQATIADIFRANKVIRKIKMNKVPLVFSQLKMIEKSTVHVFADESFKSLPGGASQGGFIILLGDEEGNVCPIHWQSKKIKRVVKSSLAAECLALQEASDVAFYIKTVLADILKIDEHNGEIKCFTYNKSLYESLYSSRTLEEKRLILDEAIIKDMLRKKELTEVCWIEKSKQIAYALTKSTASTRKLCDVLTRGSISPLF